MEIREDMTCQIVTILGKHLANGKREDCDQRFADIMVVIEDVIVSILISILIPEAFEESICALTNNIRNHLKNQNPIGHIIIDQSGQSSFNEIDKVSH